MIKDNDYTVTLAPMKTKLKLKGQALSLFAIIYGYSKDGESTCRTSLSYLAEWLDTDKSAVSKLIKRLESAGYINKIEYMRGDMKCYEYTSNYGVMLARAERGEPMGLTPTKRVVKSTTVVKSTKKGCQFDHERVVNLTTNNKYNIIYNNFYCAGSAPEKEEKKFYSQIFFLRKAADPMAEAERFISYNQANGWRNMEGRTYDTIEQRIGLAGLWKFELGEAEGVRRKYMDAIDAIVDESIRQGMEDVAVLADPRHGILWDKKENRWWWSVTQEGYDWINASDAHKAIIHRHLDPVFNGIPVTFRKVS